MQRSERKNPYGWPRAIAATFGVLLGVPACSGDASSSTVAGGGGALPNANVGGSSLAAGGGVSATAPSTDQATAYGLVFLGGELTAASSVSTGSVALGRNWGAYGAAAYLQTALGAHINPVGWLAMGSNTLDTARFSEYRTTGAGATAANIAKRASQSKQLTASEAAAYTIANIFGAWTPSFSQ